MKVKLEDVCAINPHDQNTDLGIEVSFISMSCVSDEGDVDLSHTRFIHEVKKGYTPFRNGDVLMAKITPCMENLKGAYVTGLMNGIGYGSTEFHVLRANDNIICAEWLYYFSVSKKFRQDCERHMTGSGGQKRVSTNYLAKYVLTIPSIQSQKQQAQTLTQLKNIIKIRRQQLRKLDELVKCRFVEMFGDPVLNPLSWVKNSLGKLGSLGRGVSKHRPRNAAILLNGSHPLIQTGDVAASNLYIEKYLSTYSDYGLQQSKKWPENTLCITIAANIAKTAILKFDSCFPDSVVGFISGKKTNQIFIHVWFSFFQSILEAQAPQSAQKNLNLKTLKKLQVITPPIHLQNKFASFVHQLDKSRFAIDIMKRLPFSIR